MLEIGRSGRLPLRRLRRVEHANDADAKEHALNDETLQRHRFVLCAGGLKRDAIQGYGGQERVLHDAHPQTSLVLIGEADVVEVEERHEKLEGSDDAHDLYHHIPRVGLGPGLHVSLEMGRGTRVRQGEFSVVGLTLLAAAANASGGISHLNSVHLEELVLHQAEQDGVGEAAAAVEPKGDRGELGHRWLVRAAKK